MLSFDTTYRNYGLSVLAEVEELRGCCGVMVIHNVSMHYFKTGQDPTTLLRASKVPAKIKRILYNKVVSEFIRTSGGVGRIIFTDALCPNHKIRHPTLLGMGKLLKLNGHNYYTINRNYGHEGNKNYLFSIKVP